MCLELSLPSETFHFLSQFHFVNVIYSVVFENAKYAYRVGSSPVNAPWKAAGNRGYLHSDRAQT